MVIGRKPACQRCDLELPRQRAVDVSLHTTVIDAHMRAFTGVTWVWRPVIASSEWARRRSHTTVMGAAGAIYVIGGYDGTTVFNDVLVSTDGGADRTCVGFSGGY
jgi:hypothetical protein